MSRIKFNWDVLVNRYKIFKFKDFDLFFISLILLNAILFFIKSCMEYLLYNTLYIWIINIAIIIVYIIDYRLLKNHSYLPSFFLLTLILSLLIKFIFILFINL